ncbi:hypothetical protein BJ878DRAFT_307164 [Calycina marina]|uniref:DH domain-containing protein n=1 Tax=Calycina marina TaxID=1763456 RepID=A0A9P7YV34_9HELO|nr:hypothetical protein BJ878DRAFT_307164 [Calycina marina]
MVQLTEPPLLSQDNLTLYYAADPHLAGLPVLLFHGPSTTANNTLNSSRIQVHVLSAGGFQSFPRITISPNSPFYQSVNNLPRERQGDEICRGLAFGLLKYFRELPQYVQSSLVIHSGGARKKNNSTPKLFDEQHAADVAAAMVKVDNLEEVIKDVEAALRPQYVQHLDVDLVLPPGSIAPLQEYKEHWEDEDENEEMDDPALKQYGMYAPLVKVFGEVTFLPTSKMRRAPSRPTSVSRSRTFHKDQKISLRREMAELVDTEERYVTKMHELVSHLADDFREKARSREFGSFSPSATDLEKLFPKSLDRVLQVNAAFLEDIRRAMDETEEEAMLDLEGPVVGSSNSRHGGSNRTKDPTGAVRFAKVLLEWFPRFTECYQDYMHASLEFPQIISSFMQQPSSFSQRVQQNGEQRLRSAIIEPVQRLPRYSLFIDNIVNYLPVAHPALIYMLRARDIITDICSMDPPSDDKFHVVNRLRNLVEAWPANLHPQGRLITAVDFAELSAPYHTVSPPHGDGMLLFFADCVVVLKKTREGSITARTLTSEVDKPTAAVMMGPVTAAAGGQKFNYELQFSGWHILGDTRFTISDDSRCLWMSSLHELKDAGTGRDRRQAATIRYFMLKGLYDGKATRLTEEITRTRLEGRFSESERESGEWSYRSVTLAAAEITLHTAVFAESVDSLIKNRREPAPIRVVVDHNKGTKGAPVGHYGIDIVANVRHLAGGTKYRLEVDGLNDKVFVDEVVPEHVLPVFAKRIVGLLGSQYQSNPTSTAPFISFYTKILKSMHLTVENEKAKSFRPPSPVKLLSNLLSSGFGGSTSSLNHSFSNSKKLGEIPALTRSNSNKSTHTIHEIDPDSSFRAVPEDRPSNPIVRLEETFTGYIAALQSRKGNIVGKVIRNRAIANELDINALYNTLIENPFDTRATSEVTVDVLFSSFEKYIRRAWKMQMGQVMSRETLDGLQDRATKLHSNDFADFVQLTFGEMAPQNRRAFIAIVKLLADLLEGCGNDGDRGALTAAFAELLVTEGNPHDYINLLDRMVEDCDHLFEEMGPGAIAFGARGSSIYGSISGNRSNHSNTGSLTSNASSLRRKFDSLLRQNGGRTEVDTRPSVWRTLSKNGRNPATGDIMDQSSFSKTSLHRSGSIESPRRPMSRDRPTIFGTFDERPASSHSLGGRLSTIRASPPAQVKADPVKHKRNRRSSLSDLVKVTSFLDLGGSPIVPLPSPNRNKGNATPTKIPVSNSMMDRGRQIMYRSGSPGRKESLPFTAASNITASKSGDTLKDTTPVTKPTPSTRPISMSSGIPTLRGTPSSSTVRTDQSPSKGPNRIRLLTATKIDERIEAESKTAVDLEQALEDDVKKVKDTLDTINLLSPTQNDGDIQTLHAGLAELRSKIPVYIKQSRERIKSIKKDLDAGLRAQEFKNKELERLHQESAAENELLYEKFNGELGKIFRALKGKTKDDREELARKIKESMEEVGAQKKENIRLKREIISLRTALKASKEE